MNAFPEGRAFLKWHNAADLKTPAGAAEAKALLRKFTNVSGGTITFEFDELGIFRSTGTAREVIHQLDRADPKWFVAAPFHVEVDAVTGNTSPPKSDDG